MFNDEIQKFSADVCLLVHTVGWIKPNYASLSVLAAILRGVAAAHKSPIVWMYHRAPYQGSYLL